MTKEAFEKARWKSAARYLQAAQNDYMKPGATKRQKNNAARRIKVSTDHLSLWKKEGFWTPDNALAYETIYRHYPEDDPVSAF